MKKILILPFFGLFNNYFPIWLESAKNNKNIDFLIITDVNWTFETPQNVTIVNRTFEDIKSDFERKLGFSINLIHPYKLCDYKPYYGFLFEEFLEKYDFWGYCDCDLIFGNIENFLPESIFAKYDKIMRRGHLSFVRNTYEINRNFLKYDTYKIVLKSPCIYGLDESIFGFHYGFAGELLEQGYRFYENNDIVGDIDFRCFPFHSLSQPEEKCIFHYQNGTLFMIRKEEYGYSRNEIMYAHLQKRKMEIDEGVDTTNYLIIPNRFILYDESLLYSESFWQGILTEKDGYFNYKNEKKETLKRDLLRLFFEPHKIKSIKYRILGEK